MTLWRLVRTDVLLQFRYGFHAAYGFIAVAYVVVVQALPSALRVTALPLVILSEACVIGFFFAGTLLHLEKSDGTLDALAVTPVHQGTYVFARILSLSLLTTAFALAIGSFVFDGLLLPLLAAATILTTAVCVGCGLAAATRLRSLERFVIWGGLGTAAFALPVLPYLGLFESPLWWIVPTHPTLVVMAHSTNRYGDMTTGAGLVLLGLWAVLAFLLARASLEWNAVARVSDAGE